MDTGKTLPPVLAKGLGGAAGVLYLLMSFFAYPPHEAAELAYVILLPFLLWLVVKPGRRFFLSVAFAAAWLDWLIKLRWLPEIGAQIPGSFGPVLGWFLTLALAAVLALFFWAWAWAAHLLLSGKMNRSFLYRLSATLALVGLWILLEWLRSWVLTGFPWLPLASTQWQRPVMLQIGAWTGMWGVSAILVFFNVAMAHYLVHLLRPAARHWWGRLSPDFYLAFGLILAVFGIGLQSTLSVSRLPGYQFSVGLVQPNYIPEQKWNPELTRVLMDDLAYLTRGASYLDADLVVWPETPLPFPLGLNEGSRRWVRSTANEAGVPLVAGDFVKAESEGEGNAYLNAVSVILPDSGLENEYVYGKRHLVPFGEYIPFAGILPWLEKFVPIEGALVPGDQAAVFDLSVGQQSINLGPLICYEDVFPRLARATVQEGAEILLVVTNNAWYAGEAGSIQHAAHSVMRAVENRTPVVRCGNNGWSGWIDAYGHIRAVMTNERGSMKFQGVRTVDINSSRRDALGTSFYTRYGDWFVALSAGLLVLGWLGTRFFLRVVDLPDERRDVRDVLHEKHHRMSQSQRGRFRRQR